VSISEKLKNEIISAMKAKEKFRLNALRYMKSLLQNNLISSNPFPEEKIIISYHKKMVKSLKLYTNTKAIEDQKKEIAIIEEFIPKSMSDGDILKLVEKHLALGNIGQVMKAVKEEITGPFDGKKVSGLIQAKLLESSNG